MNIVVINQPIKQKIKEICVPVIINAFHFKQAISNPPNLIIPVKKNNEICTNNKLINNVSIDDNLTINNKNNNIIPTKKRTLVIINIPFNDWRSILYSCKNVICIKENNLQMYTSNDYKIIPICVDDYIRYNHLENNIFKNNLNNVDILNNKSKFGKYLLDYFPDNIAPIYYYNFDNETFIMKYDTKGIKMILKPNNAFGGKGIKIIYELPLNIKNHIIQKYIEHTEYMVGHFLVLNGVIQKKIYFISSHQCNNGIKCGRIVNYIVKDTINIDDNVFDKIFYNLNYSGFADADFIIHNDTIIIFEINPRPGGSLIFNSQYLNIFFEKLTQIIN